MVIVSLRYWVQVPSVGFQAGLAPGDGVEVVTKLASV